MQIRELIGIVCLTLAMSIVGCLSESTTETSSSDISPSPAELPEIPISTTDPGLITPAPQNTLKPSITPNHEIGSVETVSTSASESASATAAATSTSDHLGTTNQGRLVFASRRGDSNLDGKIDNDDEMHIFVLDLGLRSESQLTSGRSLNWNPVWSPDGTKIAFASDRDGQWDLYIMEADGKNVQRITETPFIEQSVTWSPAGGKLAYVVQRQLQDGTSAYDLLIQDLAQGTTTLVREDDYSDQEPDWSPDGRYLAFTVFRPGVFGQQPAQYNLMVYSVETDRVTQLDLDQILMLDQTVQLTDPHWFTREENTYLSFFVTFSASPPFRIYVIQIIGVDEPLEWKPILGLEGTFGQYRWARNGQVIMTLLGEHAPATDDLNPEQATLRIFEVPPFEQLADSRSDEIAIWTLADGETFPMIASVNSRFDWSD